MRTPAGFECRYFYGNYHRGRKQEECRLIGDNWSPDLCKTCPVPAILRANACTHMVFEGTVNRFLFGLKKQVTVKAYCTKSGQAVEEPEIGCGQCHPLPQIFMDDTR